FRLYDPTARRYVPSASGIFGHRCFITFVSGKVGGDVNVLLAAVRMLENKRLGPPSYREQ
ncbi:MAG: hypothetical protein QF767_11295, partial [Alphaproteobacteria bacterium]|nr:hypothetical protein [Alphaproteobacteria bacterium]